VGRSCALVRANVLDHAFGVDPFGSAPDAEAEGAGDEVELVVHCGVLSVGVLRFTGASRAGSAASSRLASK
jgi:hypothetical protein